MRNSEYGMRNAECGIVEFLWDRLLIGVPHV